MRALGPGMAAACLMWPLAAAAEAPPASVERPAQTTPAVSQVFSPADAFAPLTLPEPVNRYRSADGAPGPEYWQNRADYDIAARLDPKDKTLNGAETITYTNNSPSALTSLWLQLDQNIYRPDARAAPILAGWRKPGDVTQGYTIDAVALQGAGGPSAAPFEVYDTRMTVPLRTPLGPGATLKIIVSYHYKIPGLFGGRTAWMDTRNGPIFDVAQWFPRMCVFDDVRGWDTLPYLAQEFYLEYGDINYAITAPGDMIVMGDGELQNPAEVLTAAERAQLAKARSSDRTVFIRPPDAVAAAHTGPVAEKTWRYRMTKTRDVAFSASHAFIWDAARIRLPGGRTALAESVYPIESAGDAAWGRSTEYTKDAIERFSEHWFVYPYPTAVSIAGGASGMEYPGLVFDGVTDKGKELFWITAHEFGHTWFPMTVGSDERRNAWMDEGMNTFIDTFESDEFSGGVYGPKRDSEYAPGGGSPVDEILQVLADPKAPPIMTRADLISEAYRHKVTYFKAALGLRLLRDQILGPPRFDRAFRRYIALWAFKHPKPSDFFRAMQSEAGEDLTWWWRGWFFENWSLDLAVTSVDYIDGVPDHGARITVATKDKLVAPSVVEVRYVDGSSRRLGLPVESWQLGSTALLTAPAGPKIASVTVDPDHELPDRDRSDNTLKLP